MLLAGDFIECDDGTLDRFPPRRNDCLLLNNNISALCSGFCTYLALFSPLFTVCDFTWSNRNRSYQSRIDVFFFLLSSSVLQFVNDISHSFAPLSGHKQIILKMSGNTNELLNLRGYWKYNNSLLKDNSFNDSIKDLIPGIFQKSVNIYKTKCFFFSSKARKIAIRRIKELKASKI